MTLVEIKDWVKTKTDVGEGIAVGRVDGGKEKYLAVFPRPGENTQRVCLGGPEYTRLQYRRAAVLVHWTKAPGTAEKKALELHAALGGCYGESIGGWRVVVVDPGEAPVYAGVDAREISEWVINLTIAYEPAEQAPPPVSKRKTKG